jgi:hypothetical protein
MKVKPIRFAENNLYRHKDFALPPSEEQSSLKREQHQTPVRPNQALRTRTEHLGESMSADFDDEFDGTLFDGVEITEHTDDAFKIESASGSHATGPKTVEAAKPVHLMVLVTSQTIPGNLRQSQMGLGAYRSSDLRTQVLQDHRQTDQTSADRRHLSNNRTTLDPNRVDQGPHPYPTLTRLLSSSHKTANLPNSHHHRPNNSHQTNQI